jgi:hypothetical protein
MGRAELRKKLNHKEHGFGDAATDGKKRIHHRDTEAAEFGEFFIRNSFLCALRVSAVSPGCDWR